MSLKMESLIAPMLFAALAVMTPVAFAQQSQAPAQTGPGGGMMQPGGMGPGNVMRQGGMPGMSGTTQPMMDNCRRMLQGDTAASDDTTKEMMDRCRAIMQESPQANPPAAANPPAPDQKE